LAPGAIACAYSTSSVVSNAQPVMSSLVASNGGTGPAGWMTFSDGGSGRPKSLSNWCTSLAIVGEPNESTMTIVLPLPVRPLA
jgi:hypothetical protein